MSRKIRLKRGALKDLPQLELGEPGVATDEGTMFIGTDRGNIRLANQEDLDGVSQQLADTSNNVEYLLNSAGGNPSLVQEIIEGAGNTEKNFTKYGDYLSILNIGDSQLAFHVFEYNSGHQTQDITLPVGVGYSGFFEDFSGVNITASSSFFAEVRGKGVPAPYPNSFLKDSSSTSISSAAGYKGSSFTANSNLALEEVAVIGSADSWAIWTLDANNAALDKVGEGIFDVTDAGYSRHRMAEPIHLTNGQQYALFAIYSLENEGKYSNVDSNINTDGLITPHRRARTSPPFTGAAFSENSFAYDYKVVVKEVEM